MPHGRQRNMRTRFQAVGAGGVRNQRKQRLPNGTDRHSREVSNVRAIYRCRHAEVSEIAVALGFGGDVLRDSGRILLPAPFFGEEKESLFLVAVVMIRDEYRPADGVTEVMLFIGSFGLGEVGAFIPGAGIENVVAEVFKGAAVERAATGLGFDFDGSRGVTAILCTIVGSEDFELSDSLGVGVDVERRVAAVIHIVAAVEFPIVVFGAAAVHAVGDVAIDAN